VVFTGDALFAGGIGRTDFPGASHKTLLESIRKRLFALPPETVVYPGHGPPTTVGDEARGNPWL
jgi:glyoxylase-like metal-dependent hydrolase (beta-lactamase superfamily II)